MTCKFRLFRLTQQFVSEKEAEGLPVPEDFVVGKWEIEVIWPDDTVDYVGWYKTRKEAQQDLNGFRKDYNWAARLLFRKVKV